jgi:hypothetical protein
MTTTPESGPVEQRVAEQNVWIPAQRPHVGLSAPAPLPWELPGGPVVARSTGRRLGMLAAMVIGIGVAHVGMIVAVTSGLDPSAYATQAEYDAAVNFGVLVAYGLCLPVMLALYACLAPKVGYRRRDAFFLFLPIWSYYFCVKILWRVTALPDRDWTPRHDDPTLTSGPEFNDWVRT